VWVRLPHLPLIFWDDYSLKEIGNKLGHYLDRAEPKGNLYSCARICVEVDLEKGLPEALQINLDQWSHHQVLDYEQIPFKCMVCHAHGHFAKNCPKIQEEQPPSKLQSRKELEFKTVPSR
jgi:hypothetical protein